MPFSLGVTFVQEDLAFVGSSVWFRRLFISCQHTFGGSASPGWFLTVTTCYVTCRFIHMPNSLSSALFCQHCCRADLAESWFRLWVLLGNACWRRGDLVPVTSRACGTCEGRTNAFLLLYYLRTGFAVLTWFTVYGPWSPRTFPDYFPPRIAS